MFNAKHSGNRKSLVLIQLNEINFDVVAKYIAAAPGRFPALQRLMQGPGVRTSAEQQYEALEPWIQWVSVYTGRDYAGHQVFRLGDSVNSTSEQIFERLESAGLKVGAISPINAANRLTRPAYFIPDPWTKTKNDGSFWSRKLAQAVSQVVNDNSQAKVSRSSALYLTLALLRFARPKHWPIYLRLMSKARGVSWRKALLLDLLLSDVHHSLYRRTQPDFSALFLNAGAHIQHHYFLNAAPLKATTHLQNPSWYVAPHEDPVAEMLEIYDRLVADALDDSASELIVATALSQMPYDRIKFYYRLKDHADFLRRVGVIFKAVHPRMTRDFLIEFDSTEQAAGAERVLRELRVSKDDEPLFKEIDNRGNSLFVTLTYPHEIDQSVTVEVDKRTLRMVEHVAFVAIKNGMHQGQGFAYFTPGVAPVAPQPGAHVSALHGTVSAYFGI